MFALQKNTLSLKQQNKQLASDCDNLECTTPVFARVFNFFGEIFNSLVDGKLPR